MSTNEFDLFLSHSSLDKGWVERLGADLESHMIGEPGIRVYIDKWDIPVGANITLHLDDALKRSAFVALIMTPEMLTSDWCKAEWSSQVYSDPTNRLGRILPMRLRDISQDKTRYIDVPSFLQSLSYFDFRSESDYKRELLRLVARVRGDPAPRGRHSRTAASLIAQDDSVAAPVARADPDGHPETLISNCLHVTGASPLWTGRTRLSKPILSSNIPLPPSAVIRGGLLVSFANPLAEDNPYRGAVASSDITSQPMEQWISEPAKRGALVELLNIELTRYLAQFSIGFDRSHDRYVVEPKGEGTRLVRTASGRSRWILRAPDIDKTGFWIHQASRLHFEFAGDRLLLVVDPGLTFTSNGYQPAPREMIPRLQAQWTGRERNRAVLGSMLLWIDLLTQGRQRIRVPNAERGFEIRRLPLVVRCPKGVAGDHVDIKVLRDFVETDFGTGEGPPAFAFLENASMSEVDGEDD